MPYFLQDIAKYTFSTYKNNISEISIIFPNKRARLYFNKYLSELIDKPIWTPTYFTIDELMQYLSKLHVPDNLVLIFELYDVYRNIFESPESFDDFYFYTEMLLSDFDDIDKYLVNPRDIFQNLTNIKNLENYFNYLTEKQIETIRQFWDTFSPSKI